MKSLLKSLKVDGVGRDVHATGISSINPLWCLTQHDDTSSAYPAPLYSFYTVYSPIYNTLNSGRSSQWRGRDHWSHKSVVRSSIFLKEGWRLRSRMRGQKCWFRRSRGFGRAKMMFNRVPYSVHGPTQCTLSI